MRLLIDRMHHESTFPGYYKWLTRSCRSETLDSSSALAVGLGEFEINPGNFWTGVTLSKNYTPQDITHDYDWLCESDPFYIGDVYRLKDSDMLLTSLAMAIDLEL